MTSVLIENITDTKVENMINQAYANHADDGQLSGLLEEERRARQEAEEKNRAKDEFFAFFLHELKSPLNAVSGWTYLLKKGSLNADQSSQAIETIRRNSDLLNELIEDLLDFSRIINGKMEVDLSTVNLCEIIEDSLEDWFPAARRGDILLTAGFNASCCEIPGDAKRLRQIFSNLLSNAIKFTPPGGDVTIDLKKEKDTVEITVKDSGSGISPAFLPFIFERFRQGDAKSQNQQNGLGLGLAVVRFLIEKHNGTITANSDGINKGAQFTVILPLSAPLRKQIF